MADIRKIYLLRHAEPLFPDGRRQCIGCRTDYHLSETGISQAKLMSDAFRYTPVTSVWSSPLARCRETAALIFGDAYSGNVQDDLREMDCGEWDGVAFDDIRERFPEIWQARADDITIPIPGGETYAAVAERVYNAVLDIASRTSGDIAIVAHSGANSALLCKLYGKSFSEVRGFKQDYASVSVLLFDGESLSVSAMNRSADSLPTPEECDALWRDSGTPENVRRHCIAVRDIALSMADKFSKKGYCLNTELLSVGAELHDLYRTQKAHGHVCAETMRQLGYLKLAHIIDVHHGGIDTGCLDEATILYLADKYVDNEMVVTIDERFQKSSRKLTTSEAKAAHAARYNEAKAAEKLYLSAVGEN
jgi:broad specificity phosphatase PhoE